MEKTLVEKISKQVYRRFPEVNGAKPSIKQSKSAPSGENYVLTYKGSAAGPGGRSIPRNVRVVADAKGKIIRMSTSK